MPDDHIDEETIEAAWTLARPIVGHDSRLYRMAPDVLQSVIRRDRYNIRGKFGWRIEHGRPVSFHRISMEAAMRRVGREIDRSASKPSGQRIAR